MFYVIKSPFRNYGYSVKSTIRQDWIVGGYIVGWHRYKKDAEHRAEIYNKSYKIKEI